MIFPGNDLIRSQYTKLYLGNFILLNKLRKKNLNTLKLCYYFYTQNSCKPRLTRLTDEAAVGYENFKNEISKV